VTAASPAAGDDPDAGTLPVRLEYTYTADDLLEAQAADAWRPGTRGRRRLGLAAVLLLVAAAAVLQTYNQLQPDRPLPPGGGPPPTREMARVVLPWVVYFGVIGWSVFGAAFRQTHGRKRESFLFPAADGDTPDGGTNAAPSAAPSAAAGEIPSTPPRPWPLYAVIACVAVSMLVATLVGWRERVGAGRPGFTADLFRSLLPVAILGVILTFLLRGSGRAAAERLLRDSPHLQLPKTAEAREEVFAVADAASRAEHRWESFDRVVETPTVFLLYHSPTRFTPVPKRAFSSPRHVASFRELLRRAIAGRPGPAFPVIAAAAGAARTDRGRSSH
jgi:hypothetical protein